MIMATGNLIPTYCPYGYVGYGDLPTVTVSRFIINHVESRAGVVTPHFGRQTRRVQFLPLLFFSLIFAVLWVL